MQNIEIINPFTAPLTVAEARLADLESDPERTLANWTEKQQLIGMVRKLKHRQDYAAEKIKAALANDIPFPLTVYEWSIMKGRAKQRIEMSDNGLNIVIKKTSDPNVGALSFAPIDPAALQAEAHNVAEEFFANNGDIHGLIRPFIERVGLRKMYDPWSIQNLTPMVGLLNDRVALGKTIDTMRAALVEKERVKIGQDVVATQEAVAIAAKLQTKSSGEKLNIEEMVSLTKAEVEIGAAEALRPLRVRRIENLDQIMANISSPK